MLGGAIGCSVATGTAGVTAADESLPQPVSPQDAAAVIATANMNECFFAMMFASEGRERVRSANCNQHAGASGDKVKANCGERAEAMKRSQTWCRNPNEIRAAFWIAAFPS
jgi:hypothetical protein